MSSKTKIVVLHMKEIIYTCIFLTLTALLVILLLIMFKPGNAKETAATTSSAEAAGRYTAGVYTTPIELNDNSFDVQVTVDTDRIKSIDLINISESTAAMYPLMEPSIEALESQILSSQTTDNILFTDENKYTSALLLEAVKSALGKALPN